MAIVSSIDKLVGLSYAPLGTDPLSSFLVVRCPVWGLRKKKNLSMSSRGVGVPVFVSRSGRRF